MPTFSAKTCDEVACPMKAGPLKFPFSYPVPEFTPKGDYKGELSVKDESGGPVACITYSIVMQ